MAHEVRDRTRTHVVRSRLVRRHVHRPTLSVPDMSTRPGSHFRTEPTGRELRVRLMAACGATVRFMADAEGCPYNTIKGMCWKHSIPVKYQIDMTERLQHGPRYRPPRRLPV